MRNIGISQLLKTYDSTTFKKLPLTLTNHNIPFAVILSLKEYNSLVEAEKKLREMRENE